MSQKCYWVYILYCDNDTYYTGYTTDVKKRFLAHVDGSASKYTRSFKPLCIIQCWKIHGEKSLAMHIERHIKKLSRDQKEKIIKEPLSLCTDLRIKVARKFNTAL